MQKGELGYHDEFWQSGGGRAEAVAVRAGEAPLLASRASPWGDPSKRSADRVIMETALPVRYMENLREVEIGRSKASRAG